MVDTRNQYPIRSNTKTVLLFLTVQYQHFFFIWLRHTLLACFLASFPLLFVLSSGFPHTDFLEYLFYLAIDTLRSGGNVYAALDAVCIGRRWAGSITYCTVYFFLEAVSRMLL